MPFSLQTTSFRTFSAMIMLTSDDLKHNKSVFKPLCW